MGISFIDDAWDSLENTIKEGVAQIGSAFNSIWEEVAMPLLEGIFNLLGFEGETVYSTAISTTKLVEDPAVNNLAATVLKAIIQNSSIVEGIQTLILTGSVASAIRYYEYGESQYIYGLPTVTRRAIDIDANELTAVISTDIGVPVTLLTYNTGTPSADIWAKAYLENTYNYTESSKEIYIDGLTWLYDYAVRDAVTGVTTIYVTRGVTVTTLTVVYSYTTINLTTLTKHNKHIEYTTTVSTIAANTQQVITELGDIEEVVYLSSPQTGNFSSSFGESIGFFGSGFVVGTCSMQISSDHIERTIIDSNTENTSLDDYIAPPLLTPYYYVEYHLTSDPTDIRYWVYLMDSGTYPSLQGDLSVQEYPDLLAMPVAALKSDFVTVDNLHADYESTSALLNVLGLSLNDLTTALDDNADAEQIRDAYVTLSINLFTKTEAGLDYLFKFFMGLVHISTITKARYEEATVPTLGSAGTPVYPPEPVNTITVTEGNYNVSLNYSYMTITEYPGSIGALNTCASSYEHAPRDVVSGYLKDIFTIQWQYSTTAYKQIEIHGLFMVTVLRHVNGTTNLQVTTISDDPAVQKNFEIPLVLPSLKVYEYRLADALVYEALTLQVFAADSIYLEWYETESFTRFVVDIIQVVAVVIFAISLGSAGSMSAVLLAFAQTLLVHFALTYTLEYILKNTDNEAIRYLAMLLYVGASVILSPGSVDLTSIATLLNIVSAVALATSVYVSVETELLFNEMEQFGVTAQERQDEIDRVRDLVLVDGATIDYWDIMSTSNRYSGESPSQFYYRTGLRNPGVLVLDEISMFTSRKLRLPAYIPDSN